MNTIAITKSTLWPFENRTVQNPIFKKSGFWMVGFQIPTPYWGLYRWFCLIFRQALWGVQLRGVQGLLQEDSSKGVNLRLSWNQKLYHWQATAEQVMTSCKEGWPHILPRGDVINSQFSIQSCSSFGLFSQNEEAEISDEANIVYLDTQDLLISI